MKRPVLFALGAVAATCLSTVCAFAPISRMLSKIGGDPFLFAKALFAREVLPSMAAGLILVVLALCLAGRRPVVAVLLLAAAPVAVFATDIALLALT